MQDREFKIYLIILLALQLLVIYGLLEAIITRDFLGTLVGVSVWSAYLYVMMKMLQLMKIRNRRCLI